MNSRRFLTQTTAFGYNTVSDNQTQVFFLTPNAASIEIQRPQQAANHRLYVEAGACPLRHLETRASTVFALAPATSKDHKEAG
jgi:hypothetical protein